MLTYDDQTVENAEELFASCRDLPVSHWGFKNVGLNRAGMIRLAGAMKDAERTVYLEVVSLDEEAALAAVETARTCAVDVFMGTVYTDTVREAAQLAQLDYFPFVGTVAGHPSVLSGAIEEISQDARDLTRRGVQGLDLLSYRHPDEPERLLREVVQATPIPVVSAGSINSYARIRSVWDAGAWAFTIGSAFFDSSFAPGMSFRDNLIHVLDWLAQEQERQLSTVRR